MPVFTNAQGYAPNRFAIAPEDRSSISSAVAGSRTNFGLGETSAYMAGLGVTDLVDTVASSLPLVSDWIGVKRGDVNQAALNAMDMPQLTNFYHDYKGGVEATSGIGGLIVSELLTRKITAPAGLFMKGLKTLPWARRIATLDNEYYDAMAVVRGVDRSLAERGALGYEQFAGRVNISDLGEGLGAAERLGLSGTISRDVARGSALKTGFLKGAKDAALTEATMGLLLNQNGFLYTDSAAQNVAWMALGVVGGGGLNWVQGAYQARKFVNSDEIRKSFANALDPDKSETARSLAYHGHVTLTGDERNTIGFLGGQFSDSITSYLISHKTLADSPVTDLALRSNREQLSNQWLKLAEDTADKITTKGITTNGFTRFSMDSRGFGNHVSLLNKRDAGWAYGVEMLGGIPDELTGIGVHQAHMNRLDELEQQLSTTLEDPTLHPAQREDAYLMLQRTKFEQSLIPQPYIDGEAATLSDLAAVDNWVEPVAAPAKKIDDTTTLWETVTEGPRGIGLDSNLNIYLPNNTTLDKADHYDILRLYRQGQRAIQHFANGVAELHLPKKANWFQLDLAEEILKKNPQAKVNFPTGMTREDAQVESFAQKAEAIQFQKQKIQNEIAKYEMAIAEGKKIRGAAPLNEEELASRMRMRYNLPKLTAYERGVLGETDSPIESLLRGAGTAFGADGIRSMNSAELKQAVAEYKRIGDLQPVSPKDIESLNGNSFRFLLDDEGKPIKPLLSYKRPLNSVDWAKDRIEERLAQRKLFSLLNLTAKTSGPSTRNGTQLILTSPDYLLASQTHELMETQIQGVFGASHQDTTGALGKSVITREQRDRDAPAMLAASRLQQGMSNFMRGELKAVSEASGLTEFLAGLNSPRNASTKLLLSQFHSFRPGWDLSEEIVDKVPTIGRVDRTAPDGKKLYAVLLDQTDKNRARWRSFFGTELPQGQTLLGPNGKEVVLDETGWAIQEAFNKVTERHRWEQNSLLRAQGLKEISRVPMFVPSPQVEGKYIGFVMNSTNEIIPGSSIVANTLEDFDRQKKVLFDSELLQRPGNVFRTRDQVVEFMDIWDRAQMDMIDPGTTAIQGGRPATGKLTGMQVDVHAFDNSLSTTRDRFLNHGNDIIATLMKEQINAAKARSAIAGGVTRNRTSFYRDQKYRSIHDYYLENLLGKSGLSASGSPVGRLYNSIEGTIDGYLTKAGPAVSRIGQGPLTSRVMHALNNWIDKPRAWDRSDTARKDFESLSNHLGDWMPFKSAHDFTEARGAGSMPPTLAAITGKINRFTAAMMLRVAEVGMPIVNLGGILSAAPAVIRHLSQKAGESGEEYAARVGHNANIFNLGDGRHIGTLDIGKIASRAFKKAWSRDSHPDFDYMVRNGFLTQEVAEFQKQFGAMKTKSDMERFFLGDPSGEMITGKKGVVGWMSVLTDKSEDFTRSWGHMIGLEMADIYGVTSKVDRHNFAHDIANKMIANYSPHNRPEIFQGAIGAPLGLFQSFMQNYYQRLFRYVETKDYRALATQYATQAGIFGITGVPGWSAAQSLFFHESEGDVDLNDVQNRYGRALGDLLSGGVISNVPKLFGGGAVDLYSRGDVNARLPHGITSTPAYVMGEKILGAMVDGYKMFMADHPDLSVQAVSEIAANMSPNRTIAGVIEQVGAGGYDTDKFGQVVSDTRNGLEMTYRVVGLRSMRQSQEIQAYYSNKTLMEMKSSQDDILRVATRAAIRGGNYDALPGIAQQYLQNGGDPRYFKRWLRSNYEAATTTRGQRQLEQVLKDPQKMNMVVRLLDAGVGINDDEKTTGYDTSLEAESPYSANSYGAADYSHDNMLDTNQMLPTVR